LAIINAILAVLTTVVLAAHLLCMNFCSAVPLLCLGYEWHGWRTGNHAFHRRSHRLAQDCLLWLAIGVALGFSLAVLEWATRGAGLVSVLHPFRGKVWWGLAELACYAAWMALYALWFRHFPLRRPWQRVLHWLLPLLSATNLLYHFPPLLTVMAKSARGEFSVAGPYVDAIQFRQQASASDVLAHTFHFWLASLAVAGVYWMRMASSPHAPASPRAGACLALFASLAQIPTGAWLLVVLPERSRALLLGADAWGTALLVLSLLAGFYLVQNLAAAALGATTSEDRRRITWLLILTVLLMTGALRRIRTVNGQAAKAGVGIGTAMARRPAGLPAATGSGRHGPDCARHPEPRVGLRVGHSPDVTARRLAAPPLP
jgi:hypothetical protein